MPPDNKPLAHSRIDCRRNRLGEADLCSSCGHIWRRWPILATTISTESRREIDCAPFTFAQHTAPGGLTCGILGFQLPLDPLGRVAAADSLKRVHLELGGKAPVLIFADADLAAAASSLRTAGFWNSGQECGAACRVLVHESVADNFVDQLADQVRALVVGEPRAGDDVEIGPMISKAHYDRVLGFLERARDQGAHAVVGGSALAGQGYFVAPTVLVDMPADAECVREEIFGPVVTVETFTDDDDAVMRANSVPLGLSASVWTTSASRSHDIAARLDFGTVWVNSHLVLACEVPWGGFKGSGYGRDLSQYALDDFSRTKHVMHNHAR